jgi:RHS repeat-associated protein
MKPFLDKTKIILPLFVLCASCFPLVGHALTVENGDLSVEILIDRFPDSMMQLSSYDPSTHMWVYHVKVPGSSIPTLNYVINADVPPRATDDPAYDDLLGGYVFFDSPTVGTILRPYSTVRIVACNPNRGSAPEWSCFGADIPRYFTDQPDDPPENYFSFHAAGTWHDWNGDETHRRLEVHAWTANGRYNAVLAIDISAEEQDISTMPALKGPPSENPYTDFDGGCQNPEGYGLPNYWINTSTLNLVVRDADFSYRATGQDVVFARTWNTDPQQRGMFGKGWGFTYESAIRSYGSYSGAADRIKGSGQVASYKYASHTTDNAGTVISTFVPTTAGVFDTLTGFFNDSSSYFILREKVSNLAYRYDAIEKEASGAETFRLTSITDRSGNALQIAYNPDGTIGSITDDAGRTTAFAYDVNKFCISMTVPDGRRATYAYDAAGNMVSNTDLLGTAIAYAYLSDGYMGSLSYAGKTTRFEYDTSGGWRHVSAVIDPDGNTKVYRADSRTATTVTDPLGTVTSYANEGGLTTNKSTGNLGNTGRSYHNGLLTGIRDANGNFTALEYDGRGNILKFTGKMVWDDNGNPIRSVTQYAYDTDNNLTQMTDPFGKLWTFSYDTQGHLTQMVSPMGKETQYAYNAKGLLVEAADGTGRKIGFSYDGFGNVSAMTNADGKTTTMAYDAAGLNRISTTDPLGRITRLAYDHNGRITKMTHPDDSFRSFAYDACSIQSVTDENGKVTTFQRNCMLAITRVTDPLGKYTAMEYDAGHRPVSVTDPLGRTTALAYDAAGRLTEVKKPTGESLTNQFDPNGNLLLLRDERAKETGFSYDANNHLLSVQDPLGREMSYAYDLAGRIKQRRNPDGSSVVYAYDDDGLLIGKTYSGGGSIAYHRNAVGKVSSIIDAAGTTAFTYSALDRIASIAYPDGLSLVFSYDDAGNVSSVAYPGGLVVSYTYDSRNRVRSTAWGTGHGMTLTRDPAGNPVKELRSNGTESHYAFDGTHRFLRIEHRKGSEIFASMDYQLDAAGNTTEETVALPVPHRLAHEAGTSASNEANQTTHWGADHYTYGENGNIREITGSNPLSASYDPENRLTGLTLNGVATTYTYNGLGFRTKALSGTQTRNFHHDTSGRLLFVTDGEGTITTCYIYSGRRLSAMVTSDGQTYFYHFDKTGNTIALTDGNGNIAAAYAYEPFGRIANQTGAVANPFTFVGASGVMDEGNGLFFMKNRYYDAKTGKFLQKDPIGFSGGQSNLYAYVGNNPLNRIDPDGLVPFEARLDYALRAKPPDYTLPAIDFDKTLDAAVSLTDSLFWPVWAADKAVGSIPGWGDALTAGKVLTYMAIYGYYGDWDSAIGKSSVEIAKCGIGNYLTTAERFGRGASIFMNFEIDVIASDWLTLDDRMADFTKMMRYSSKTLWNSWKVELDSLRREGEERQRESESIIP